jgi:hypothetical protein
MKQQKHVIKNNQYKQQQQQQETMRNREIERETFNDLLVSTCL